jgi:hypothetical protein
MDLDLRHGQPIKSKYSHQVEEAVSIVGWRQQFGFGELRVVVGIDWRGKTDWARRGGLVVVHGSPSAEPKMHASFCTIIPFAQRARSSDDRDRDRVLDEFTDLLID